MTEAQLQSAVIELARRLGYRWYHTHDSRRSPSGFPDLVLAHKETGRVIFVELKSDKGRVRPEQQQWINTLGIRSEVHVWRPADWTCGVIPAVLTARSWSVAS